MSANTILYPKPDVAVRIFNRIFSLLPIKSKSRSYSVLLKKHLGDLSSLKLKPGTTFSLAEDEDIEVMIQHPEGLSKSVYLNRVRNGDICYCLKQDGELVSYNWIRFTSCCAFCGRRLSFMFFPLKQDQAFTYDFYTYTKHRGKGLGAYVKSSLLYDLQSRGTRDVFTIVDPSNHISMRIHIKLDYTPVTAVYSYGLFNWTKTFLGSKRDELRMQLWMKNTSEAINNE